MPEKLQTYEKETQMQISIMQQLIKEVHNPLDLIRECISNAAASEVKAENIIMTFYRHPDYGTVFEFKDDGCGMDFGINSENPGRLDRFIHVGLSGIAGLKTDEFSFKGIGSKLAFRSKRIELETYTAEGRGYKVWINEPWYTIQHGRTPKAEWTELPSDSINQKGTHLKIFGYPADRIEEVREGRLSFSFDDIKNYLLHRSFVGFTKHRESPPKILIRVENKFENLEVGFPLLKRIERVEGPGEKTNYIDIADSQNIAGTTQAIRIQLKGLYTLDPDEWELAPEKLNTGLILSVKGIPYCQLDIRQFINWGLVINPGPDKLCIICECDGINEEMNIARSGYNPSGVTLTFEKLLVKLLKKISESPEYNIFVQKTKKAKLIKRGLRIRKWIDELKAKRAEVQMVEKDGKEEWIGNVPKSEMDVLSILWKLEAKNKLPFAEFHTLVSDSKGPDLIVDFQEAETDRPEPYAIIEVEKEFKNYEIHGHSPGQMPIVICWDLGSSPKVKVKKTDIPWKFLATVDNVTIRIFTLRHLDFLVTNEKIMTSE